MEKKSKLEGLKAFFLKYLRKNITKSILKKLVISGGIKAWLISFVVGELIEEADEHLIEPAFRKVGYLRDRYKGRKIYKRVSNAQDVDDWRDSVNDI